MCWFLGGQTFSKPSIKLGYYYLTVSPPPTVYIVSKDDEEVERPLELDEVEQQVPFASEIAAGTPFGRTRHVNLMFDDREEQEARTTLQEKLSLAKSYIDRLSFDEYESATPLNSRQAQRRWMRTCRLL